MTSTRVRTLLIALVFLPAAVVGSAAPASAGTSAAAGAQADCDVYADRPSVVYGSYMSGTGYVFCTTPTALRVTVRIRQDRSWWPDRTLASRTRTRTATSFGFSASRQCSGVEGMRIFTETIVHTLDRKVQSPRVSTYC